MLLQFKMIQILSFLLCYTAGVYCLSLVGMSVPSSHPAGEDLTLSCDYSYATSESDQLVLTWYFSGSPIPIYQWVPALDLGPQVIHELFKDNLDLTYEADEDKFKKHSALRIVNPDQRFAGNYKCRVSTFMEEVSDHKDVLIYVPPTSIILANTEGVIKCAVKGVYPAPSVNLAWTVNSTVYASNEVEFTGNALNGNLIDASVVAHIKDTDIVSHDVMTCEVMIAGTDFDERVEKDILEKNVSETSTLEVHLVKELCDSSDCYNKPKDSSDDNYPADYEAVEKTIELGTGVETMSEEAAAFVSSSSSSFYVNIILVWVISSATLRNSW